MPNVRVSIEPSFKKLGKAFQSIDLKTILRNINEEISFAIERYSKQVTPVDTGRLRSSIGVSSSWGSNIRSFVEPDTEYEVYVHEGTRKMKGRPFMKWGTEFAMQKFSGDNIGWRINKELRKKLIKL